MKSRSREHDTARLKKWTGAESTGRYPNVIDTESLDDDWPREAMCVHSQDYCGRGVRCVATRFFAGSAISATIVIVVPSRNLIEI